MGSEWITTTLGEIVHAGGGTIQTGPFGSQLHASDYVSEGIPVIMPVNLAGNRISTDDIARINEADALRLARHIVKEGDIVYSRRGDVTRKALVTASEAGMFCGTGCLLVRPGKNIDPQFLAYHLSTPENHEWIIRHAVGATMPNLNTGILADVPLNIPKRAVQQSIAHILGALDDTIELNRQMNTTLESMAQALFKSWFVDFDPVIDNALAAGNPIPDELAARAERRKQLHDRKGASSSEHLTLGQPLPAAIQQQFPDRFVFTEALGWVPEGWEVSTIGEHVENTGGGTPSTKNEAFWQGGSHAFCTPKDMSRLTSWMLTDTERHLTDAGVKKVSSGLLPKRTVLMSSRAPIGYLAISDIPVSVNQGVIAMLPNALFGPLYLLSWAKFNMGNIIDRANGSTFLEISKKNFRPIPFLVPNSSACQAFNKEAEAILEKILLLSEQNISLTNLRDTLLPKLLSGQLRIPQAEQQIAEMI